MEGGPPGFPRDSSCPAVLWILSAASTFHLHDSHILRSDFPFSSVKFPQCLLQSSTPQEFLLMVWPLSLSLATTHKISFDFSSSPYLDVSVQAVPLIYLFYSVYDAWTLLHADCSIRTSALQCSLTAPRSFSQLTTSFFGSQCQGIRPALLSALPFAFASYEFSSLFCL